MRIASNSCLDIFTLPTNVITASLSVVCNAFHGLLIRGIAIGTKVIKATGSRPQPIRSFVSRRCRSHAARNSWEASSTNRRCNASAVASGRIACRDNFATTTAIASIPTLDDDRVITEVIDCGAT